VRREPIGRVLSLVTERPGRREPGTPQEERESAQGEGRHGKGDGSPAVPGNKPHSPAEQETRSKHGSSPSEKPVPGSGEEPAGVPGSGEERARAPGESAPALESGPGTVSPPPPEQASEETPADEDDSGTQATQPRLQPETQPDDDGQTAVCPEKTSQEEVEEPPHPNDLLPPENREEEGR
ncbi:MAG: hypothetical protein QME87_07900, partial [Bacillota bacterium]|nr:hypothetical protein [Bacillota bacterium]